MSAQGADEWAILEYLANTAAAGETGMLSLRGMFAEDKVVLPREDFDRDDWAKWTDLYFAVRALLALGWVDGVADDGGEHLNRFRITDEGRAAFAAGDERELP